MQEADDEMTPEVRATRVVSAWIEKWRHHLKDGGGAQGVHKEPKAALISMIAEAIEGAVAAQPPVTVGGRANHHYVVREADPEPEPDDRPAMAGIKKANKRRKVVAEE